MGQDRQSVGRLPGAFREVAGRFVRVDRSTTPGGAFDRVVRGFGGVSRVWRFDRMATVCDPRSGRVTASFAGVAKHCGVAVAICPARRGNRKGVVEKINHTAAQRWWRTAADEASVEQARASVDRFARVRGHTRTGARNASDPTRRPKPLPHTSFNCPTWPSKFGR
jgi:hypothetical protein